MGSLQCAFFLLCQGKKQTLLLSACLTSPAKAWSKLQFGCGAKAIHRNPEPFRFSAQTARNPAHKHEPGQLCPLISAPLTQPSALTEFLELISAIIHLQKHCFLV